MHACRGMRHAAFGLLLSVALVMGVAPFALADETADALRTASEASELVVSGEEAGGATEAEGASEDEGATVGDEASAVPEAGEADDATDEDADAPDAMPLPNDDDATVGDAPEDDVPTEGDADGETAVTPDEGGTADDEVPDEGETADDETTGEGEKSEASDAAALDEGGAADAVTLVAETHYSVSYADNTEIDAATVTVTGEGASTGTASKTFATESVYQPDEGTADYSGCVVVGLQGHYETTEAEALIDRVNEIRKEAAEEGIIDSYTPIQWSDSLEYAAQIRAAEAAFGGHTLAHTRPCGARCFTVEGAGNMEILAWYSDMASGLEGWYSEKANYEKYLAGDTSIPSNEYGHYKFLVTAKYIGMASFKDTVNGKAAQAGCLSVYDSDAASTDKYIVGDQDCTQLIYVDPELLTGSLSDTNVIKRATTTVSATIGGVLSGTNYAAGTPLTWTSSDTSVATVDPSSGVVRGLALGTTTITAKAGDWTVGSCTVTVTVITFTDTPASTWYMQEGWIDAASSLGLMTGMKDGNGDFTGTFDPDGFLTRAQVATVLYRVASDGADAATPSSTTFPDTKGHWAAGAIEWCAANGIATGDTDGPNKGKFRPDDPVTRQELATFVWRFATYLGLDGTVSDDSAYRLTTDKGTEMSYATNALKWCAAQGILTGNKNADDTRTIDPYGTATRAQAAKVFTVLYRDVLGK